VARYKDFSSKEIAKEFLFYNNYSRFFTCCCVRCRSVLRLWASDITTFVPSHLRLNNLKTCSAEIKRLGTRCDLSLKLAEAVFGFGYSFNQQSALTGNPSKIQSHLASSFILSFFLSLSVFTHPLSPLSNHPANLQKRYPLVEISPPATRYTRMADTEMKDATSKPGTPASAVVGKPRFEVKKVCAFFIPPAPLPKAFCCVFLFIFFSFPSLFF
jgi:hypothetical protein